jgi:flagellar L-ring protein precursor FlgH
VGDVLHVIIAERASASHVASRDLKRTARTQVGPGEGWLDFLRAMGFQGQHDSKDSAAAVRTGTLTAQVTVRVVERLPNGNLRIEGTHRVSVNRDFQAITLRGEVRPRDIRSDNTVFSYDVANLQVEYSGSDPGRPGKRLGIISRLLNALF